MLNISIFIITVFCVLVSFRLFKIASGTMSVRKLNTVSYVFYFQLVTSAIVASLLLATGKLDYHPYSEPVSYGVKIESWAWVMYSIVVMPVGMLLINRFFKVKPREDFLSYIKEKVELPQPEKYLKIIVISILVFSVLVLWYILEKSVAIPIYTLIKGDRHLASVQRVLVRYQFGGIEYIRNFLGYMLIPILSYYLFVVAFTKKKLFYYFAFALQFLFAVFIFVYDLQKAPIAFYLLGYIILITLVKGGISRKQLLLFVGLPMLLMLIAYQVTTGASAFRLFYEYDSAFYSRVFLTGYFAFPLSLELFPDIITEPTYYSGIPTAILNYFEIENIESARRLMMYMNPEGVEKGTANLFSGYYLAEAWANYGYPGLIISPFIVGMVVQTVHAYLLKNAKKVLIISFYTYITVKWLLGAGVVNFIFLKIILYPFVFYFIIKTIIKFGSRIFTVSTPEVQ